MCPYYSTSVVRASGRVVRLAAFVPCGDTLSISTVSYRGSHPIRGEWRSIPLLPSVRDIARLEKEVCWWLWSTKHAEAEWKSSPVCSWHDPAVGVLTLTACRPGVRVWYIVAGACRRTNRRRWSRRYMSEQRAQRHQQPHKKTHRVHPARPAGGRAARACVARRPRAATTDEYNAEY